jgi:hypothetical protein
MAISCKHGIELSVSIKGGKFFDQLNDYSLVRRSQLHRVSSLIPSVDCLREKINETVIRTHFVVAYFLEILLK